MSGRRWCRVAPLVAVVLVAGCTAATGGKAVPARNQLPHPVLGETVKQVLLDAGAVSKLLGRTFQVVSQFPPSFGGIEMLVDDYPLASPAECVGVVYMTHKAAYPSASVKNIARALWQQAGASAAATDVAEGVVAFPTAADANALFAKFTDQWRRCDGTTLTVPSSSLPRTASAACVLRIRLSRRVFRETPARIRFCRPSLKFVPLECGELLGRGRGRLGRQHRPDGSAVRHGRCGCRRARHDGQGERAELTVTPACWRSRPKTPHRS